jgi:hypothetical protein
MRADIHDGPEHTLQAEAEYIDARPYLSDRRNLLQRTAGPYKWVTCCFPECLSATAGVPQIAADLLQHHDIPLAVLAQTGVIDFAATSRL